jgi:hypothetical protein
MEKEFVPPPNPTKVATKWALINALVTIILTYVFYFMNVEQKSGIQYISYLPFIGFLLLTQKEFKDELGGFISFGKAFSAGFRYALFTGLVIGIFMILYLWILNPEVMEKSLEVARADMEAKDMSSADIDKAMGYTEKLGPWIGGFSVAVFYALIGAIVALIGASIFKKERSPYDVIDDATDPTA